MLPRSSSVDLSGKGLQPRSSSEAFFLLGSARYRLRKKKRKSRYSDSFVACVIFGHFSLAGTLHFRARVCCRGTPGQQQKIARKSAELCGSINSEGERFSKKSLTGNAYTRGRSDKRFRGVPRLPRSSSEAYPCSERTLQYICTYFLRQVHRLLYRAPALVLQ
jgi:hypothetical protein